MKLPLIFVIFFLFLTYACDKNEETTPKPRGFCRIDFEAKSYQPLTGPWPYHFEYPRYSTLTKEENAFSEPNWINLVFNKHKAKIHLSYKKVNGDLEALVNDSHELAYKHALKASSIEETIFENQTARVYGTLFEIRGNAASSMQFHLTDSVRHFIRGSFYISERPNYDSLLPVIQYIETDIRHLIETFSWK
jgi:gliding motility-associated lipoprotein GldD